MKNTKKYTKYKKSGVDWIKEIPEHWEVKKLKFVSECFFSNVDKLTIDSEEIVRLCNYTDVYKNDFITNDMSFMVATASESEIEKFSLKKQDIIITKDSETANDIAVPALVVEDLHNVVCGYHLAIVRPYSFVVEEYLFRLFQTKRFNSQFEINSNGVTRVGLGLYDLKNSYVILPPRDEQIAISLFIRQKLSQTDRFINKKKQLIKLLNEQKSLIISHAALKGLATDSQRKPSGIDGLGEIPSHWQIRKLKYVANCFPSNVDKHSREDEESVRLCNYTDVYKNDYICDNMDFMIATASEDQIKKFTLLQGDVIITKDSETANDIAVPAFVKEELDNVICGYHLSVLRAYSQLLGEYLFRVLQCKPINSQFEVCSNGVTRVGLGVYDLKNARIPVPSIEEQHQIVNYINLETAKIENALAKTKSEIALAIEYRKAIIAEAVTGRIDVRDSEFTDIDIHNHLMNKDDLEVFMSLESELHTEE